MMNYYLFMIPCAYSLFIYFVCFSSGLHAELGCFLGSVQQPDHLRLRFHADCSGDECCYLLCGTLPWP